MFDQNIILISFRGKGVDWPSNQYSVGLPELMPIHSSKHQLLGLWVNTAVEGCGIQSTPVGRFACDCNCTLSKIKNNTDCVSGVRYNVRWIIDVAPRCNSSADSYRQSLLGLNTATQ